MLLPDQDRRRWDRLLIRRWLAVLARAQASAATSARTRRRRRSRPATPVATVSKAFFTMRDTYGVDVGPGEDDLLILASVLALDLAEDRERAKERDQR